jgi:3-oxoacyl-[acyl-carrier protein] reductase
LTNPGLTGQVAVVTGGGRGIGEVIGRTLAAVEFKVALLGRDEATLHRTASVIDQAGGTAIGVVVDVTNDSEVEGAFARLESELGPVDLLINNAGQAESGNIWESDPATWWRVVEVNLKGPFLCSRAALTRMIPRGHGRIVNVSSYAAIGPNGWTSAYAVSKAGLLRFTDTINEQAASHGVQVFAISPGTVQTDMTRSSEAFAGFTDWTPPERVADLTVRIARGDADALAGRFIHVTDDLDKLVATADEVNAEDLYQLRLVKHPGWRGGP